MFADWGGKHRSLNSMSMGVKGSAPSMLMNTTNKDKGSAQK